MRYKFLYALLFLFVGKFAHSQTPPKAGDYVIDNNIDKFVGAWVWSSNGQSVEIILKKEKFYYGAPFNFYADVLIGCHRYIKNGVIVETSMTYINNGLDQNFTLFGNSNRNNSSNAIIQFRDLTKKKIGNLSLTINTANNQLTWTLKETEGVKINSSGYGFTLPTSIVLIKDTP